MQWDIYVWHIIVQQSSNYRWRIHFSMIITKSYKFVKLFLSIPYFYGFYLSLFSQINFTIFIYNFILLKIFINAFPGLTPKKNYSFFFLFFLFLGCVIFISSKITSPLTSNHSISGKPQYFPLQLQFYFISIQFFINYINFFYFWKSTNKISNRVIFETLTDYTKNNIPRGRLFALRLAPLSHFRKYGECLLLGKEKTKTSFHSENLGGSFIWEEGEILWNILRKTYTFFVFGTNNM